MYFTGLPCQPKGFIGDQQCTYVLKCPEIPCFNNVPVEINTLNAVAATMSETAALTVRYANFLLRATVVTRMYATKAPEKPIREKTGHRSIDRLRAYEHTAIIQEQAVSNILHDQAVRREESLKGSNNQLLTELLVKTLLS